jgi:hypothetical protein
MLFLTRVFQPGILFSVYIGIFAGRQGYRDIAPGYPRPVHFPDRQFGMAFLAELDKTEPFAFAGFRVGHQFATGDLPEDLEKLTDVRFR